LNQNLHTHTTFCDGADAAEAMVKGAITKGLSSIGFSGHAPTRADGSFCMSAEKTLAYRNELLRLRLAYAEKITIYIGLEIDAIDPASREGFDYLIGSVHYFKKDGRLLSVDHTPEILRRAQNELFSGDALAMAAYYFNSVADFAQRGDFDILGHFDLITKFNEGGAFFDEADPAYQRIALSALERAAASGKLFEVNTGAISRGWRSTPYPAPFLLQALKELGARMIVSSDAHSAQALDCGYEQAVSLLKRTGFEEIWELGSKGFFPRAV